MAAADEMKEKAREMLSKWKGPGYVFGSGCLGEAGRLVGEAEDRALVFANSSKWLAPTVEKVVWSLGEAGVRVAARAEGARPNAPREDVYRMQDALLEADAGVVAVIGGGSTIDAAKAAGVLATLKGGEHDVEPFFGVGKVTEALAETGGKLPGVLAVQAASGSAAHLTKYSNITDLGRSQKKLIVDEAIVPPKALFDYEVTKSAPPALTADGGLDGIAHIIEVYYGARGEALERVEEIARVGVELIVSNLEKAVSEPEDVEAREALGLGTDLGGYAIMVGGTNGGHLTSFSLVDVLSHGRACAVMNPYYTVLFAPAIGRQLQVLGEIYERHGLIEGDVEGLSGRDLGEAVAEGMLALSRKIGVPTTLGEVEGFSREHVERALSAAKNPQLEMKLKSMPAALSAETVDDYMGPVLEAAAAGDLSLVRAPE